MNIRLLESDVLFAFLPAEPQARSELRLVWKQLDEAEPLHLVLDMSRVEIITSPSIGTLLLLRKLQSERGMRLLLCKTRLATKCILRVVGLDAVFDHVADKAEAMKVLRHGRGGSLEVSWVGPEGDRQGDRQWAHHVTGRVRP